MIPVLCSGYTLREHLRFEGQEWTWRSAALQPVRCGVNLQTFTVPQLILKLTVFIKFKGSLACIQNSVTGHDPLNPIHHTLLLQDVPYYYPSIQCKVFQVTSSIIAS
jgi:hypothetical protein